MLFGAKKTVNLKIEGMHCEHCAARVADAVKKLGGRADVDLKLGRATANVPKDLDPAKIVEAVDALGFKAQLI